MRTFRDAKSMAKSLRHELRERTGTELSHSECLEIVSRQFGFDNWNILSAKTEELTAIDGDGSAGPTSANNSTIPILRIFSVEKATQFYVDFLGFTLDFGGPNMGEGTPFYGQVSRARTTLHLAEAEYDPYPGSTVFIWMSGIDTLYDELNVRRGTVKVWGPAVWVPDVEKTPYGFRTLTIADPFGNALRFSEPADAQEREKLPVWASSMV